MPEKMLERPVLGAAGREVLAPEVFAPLTGGEALARQLPPALVPLAERHLPGGLAAAAALRTCDVEGVRASLPAGAASVVHLGRVNDVRFINQFLIAVHGALRPSGGLVVSFEANAHRRGRLRERHPRGRAELLYLLAFFLHRVVSKLPLTKRVYFALTRGRGRMLSRAEVLGRLYYCGFRVAETVDCGDRVWVVAERAGAPQAAVPSYGPLFAMTRIGEGGRAIRVFKLRTMHPYSEYLQEYVYEQNQLAPGGKLKDDFRVTGWGRRCRRLWLDELPMLVNWIRRDLKLVGVRPLSTHYESLYPRELRERRRRVRPGLIPPFYTDLPRTFEEILESERRYLDAYERSPIRTDLWYLRTALYNILVRRARSQ